jgi:hypothetical protein
MHAISGMAKAIKIDRTTLYQALGPNYHAEFEDNFVISRLASEYINKGLSLFAVTGIELAPNRGDSEAKFGTSPLIWSKCTFLAE